MLKFVLNGTEKKISKAQDKGSTVFAQRRVSRRTMKYFAGLAQAAGELHIAPKGYQV